MASAVATMVWFMGIFTCLSELPLPVLELTVTDMLTRDLGLGLGGSGALVGSGVGFAGSTHVLLWLSSGGAVGGGWLAAAVGDCCLGW